MSALIYGPFFFQLIYEFERILAVENIREKFGNNLHSVAPAIIQIAKETNLSQKQEIKQLLNLLEPPDDEEDDEESSEG